MGTLWHQSDAEDPCGGEAKRRKTLESWGWKEGMLSGKERKCLQLDCSTWAVQDQGPNQAVQEDATEG